MEIIFLTIDEVLDLHRAQVEAFGGEASVRDLGLLQSAIAQAAATFGGQLLHEFPHGIAGAYLFHICANHPFVDGNKRAALAAALTFLDMHGLTLGATKTAVQDFVLDVAAGRATKKQAIAFFAANIAPRKI